MRCRRAATALICQALIGQALIGQALIGQALIGQALLAAAPARAADVAISGGGATFPAPVYLRWAADYQRLTGTAVRYLPAGSGAGVDLVEHGAVSFGASDAPLPDSELAAHRLQQFPAVIGAVVPVVHLDGVGPGALRLTGEVLGDIYRGRVTQWSDAAIAALNPGLRLPSTRITVVHRAEASGTSFLFSRYLAQVSGAWRTEVGSGLLPHWPVGEAGLGNEGVASYVQRTRASIGYVEYAYAQQHHLSSVALRNADGVFVQPDRDAFEAAVQAARWTSSADLTQGLNDEPGARSWPIVGASYILVPQSGAGGQAASDAVWRFFRWAFEHGADAAIALDYVPLPAAAVRWIDAGGPGPAAARR
jgi:phosphate transport system substrate-binding protein